MRHTISTVDGGSSLTAATTPAAYLQWLVAHGFHDLAGLLPHVEGHVGDGLGMLCGGVEKTRGHHVRITDSLHLGIGGRAVG